MQRVKPGSGTTSLVSFLGEIVGVADSGLEDDVRGLLAAAPPLGEDLAPPLCGHSSGPLAQ